MKKVFAGMCLCVLVGLGLVGCSSEQIKTFARDPHYTEYQQERDRLERSYLAGELTYVDYTKKTQALDDNYAREVKERESIIRGDRE